jgi:hypothetical protein
MLHSIISSDFLFCLIQLLDYQSLCFIFKHTDPYQLVYLTVWLRYEESALISQRVWAVTATTQEPISSFMVTMHKLHLRLRAWHRARFAHTDVHYENCQQLITFFDRLEEIRYLAPLEIFIIIKVRERAYELATNRELRWEQRTCCKWMSAGNKNTGFFHAYASARKQKNHIEAVQLGNAQIDSQECIQQVFLDHYTSLLGTSLPARHKHVSILYEEQKCLNNLDACFSGEEIWHTIKGMARNKACGPDGLCVEFVQQNWNCFGPHITHIFEGFHDSVVNLKLINKANIVLVPKTHNPSCARDYRPISIINLIPKLISKCLANQIRPHLPTLINVRHTIFVHKR